MTTSHIFSDQATTISLAGTWQCKLDPEKQGRDLRWFEGFDGESVILPGSLDSNGIGIPNEDHSYLGGLSRKVKYVGEAWYSIEVELPAHLTNARLELFFERAHWFSEVWINGNSVGVGESLSVPHRFLFDPAGSAHLKIVACIDNSVRYPIGRISHAITDWTQTNWNGLIGRLEIRPVQTIECKVWSTPEGLRVEGSTEKADGLVIADQPVQLDAQGCFSVLLSKDQVQPWSDAHPNLQELLISTSTETVAIKTGWRQFASAGHSFSLNEVPVFLRGTLECCVFPKTGFPPMDKESWVGVFGKVREYGLNHVRFHSWCPPQSAFEAANELGVLLQVELPLWTGNWALSSDQGLLQFCEQEAISILETYGHHPSFVLFTLGNEMSFYGSEAKVDALLEKLKERYPHILMNFSSHGTFLSDKCEYYVQADNAKPGAENRPLRGSTWFGVGSRFDREVPATTTTCDEGAADYDRPVIAHEVGEWAVFPDVYNADRYDGVLEARNFTVIAKQLEAKGMLDQAESFTYASGRLSAELYKEEIETLLRTKGLAGYQLLGLNDFPGQGTATIGMLDAFWNEKGFVSGETFSQFCAPTVPLAIAPKRVWSSKEDITIEVAVFHAGHPTVLGAEWQMASLTGYFDEQEIKPLSNNKLGTITIPSQDVHHGVKLPLTVTLSNGNKNSWDFWIFPAVASTTTTDHVKTFGWYREDVRQALLAGETVWLKLHPNRAWTGVPGRFAPAFWSPIHFKEQVGTMGTLIQSDHPVFKNFPTESFTEWHWWELLINSKSLVLDALPLSYRPIVQVIDRYERNHKLGSILEAQVGRGRLFVTFFDFESPNHIVAKNLESSIAEYLVSEDFAPDQKLTISELDAIFTDQP